MKKISAISVLFLLQSAVHAIATPDLMGLDERPVPAAQFILNTLGFNAGPVDGLFGAKTAAAMAEFHGAYGTYDSDPAVIDANDLQLLVNAVRGMATTPQGVTSTERDIARTIIALIAKEDEQVWQTDQATTPPLSGAAAVFDAYVGDSDLAAVVMDDFIPLEAPIRLTSSGAMISAMGNLAVHDRVVAAKYDVIITWANRTFPATICQQYYPQHRFLANRLVLGADQGFGGLESLADYAQHSCPLYQSNVALGAWEANDSLDVTGLRAVLDDLNQIATGLELIRKMPMLSAQQREQVLAIVTNQPDAQPAPQQPMAQVADTTQPAAAPRPETVIPTRAPEAVCSNGEQAVFHLYRTGSADWFVYLQGGGLASNADEYLSRVPMWTTPRSQEGYLQDMPAIADFLEKGFNVAVIPYCSNDLYQGAHTHVIQGQTIYFHGRAIVADVLSQLAPDLVNAARVVFGGSSAGAIGLGFNADLIAQFDNPYLLVDSFWLDPESRAVRDSWQGPNWEATERFVYANMPDHCGSKWTSCFPQRTHFDRYEFGNVFFIWNMGDPYMRGNTESNRAGIASDLAYYGQGLSIQNGEALDPDYANWVHGMLFNDYYDFPLEGGSLKQRIWDWLER